MIAVAIGLVLAPGLGAAISPMAIVAVLILLTAQGGKFRAVLFAAGVFLATLVLATIVLVVSLTAQVHSAGAPSKVASAVSLALGLLLVWFAVKQWRKRPRAGHEVVAPKWMSSLDTMSAPKAFILGVGLAFMNAKNIPLTIATVTTVVQLNAAAWVNIVTLVVFAVLGTLGVAVPVLASVIGGSKLAEKLSDTKGYLVQHNSVILSIVFLLIGAQTIGKAIGHLLG